MSGESGAQQLDVGVADVQQHRLDALVGHGLAVDQRHPELVAVARDRGVEVVDGDPDVVDCREHGSEEVTCPDFVAHGDSRSPRVTLSALSAGFVARDASGSP